MPFSVQICLIFLSIIMLLIVLKFISKRYMRIEISILWIILSISIFLVAIFEEKADQIACFFKVEYPPALFFALAISFIILILFYFSIEISKLKEKCSILNQEASLNRAFIEDLEKKYNEEHADK